MLEFRYKNQKISAGGSGQDLTAGDGTNIKGNAINVDAPFRGVFTEAEYNAIPEAKKKTGFAFIKDDTNNVYSTEETRIGTWIDNKPLYRKVYQFTSASNTNTTDIADVSFIDTLVNLYGAFRGNPDTSQLLINKPKDGNASISVWIRGTKFLTHSVSDSIYFNRPAWFTIEYTKNTEVSE